MAGADAALEFDACVDATLHTSCELARDLIGAHRAAMRVTLKLDSSHARKYVSLDPRPAQRDYAESAEPHPPLRGLLAVPVVGGDGLNCGLLRVSDKLDGTDFDEDDERRLQRLAALAALALDAMARVRRFRGGEEVPLVARERVGNFVHTDSVGEARSTSPSPTAPT
jgi:GAF domain-containing protein